MRFCDFLSRSTRNFTLVFFAHRARRKIASCQVPTSKVILGVSWVIFGRRYGDGPPRGVSWVWKKNPHDPGRRECTTDR